MPVTAENPFRTHGTVQREFFADRDTELKRFKRALQEPASKLLVYGPRRMGKTSTLQNAVQAVNDADGHAFLADLSTATTAADMANRILAGATKAVGRRWSSFISDFAGRFQAGIKLSPDPATRTVVPSLEFGIRQEATEAQQASLARVLDTLEELAGARKVTLGLVLDEFQEIRRLGGEQAEWHLRGVIQHHQHLSYIAAGSKPALLKAMLGKDRAFYELMDPFPFGPIDRSVMAGWIDDRLRRVGLAPNGAGLLCVELAGARTRDIVRLARKCVDRAHDSAPVGAEEAAAAFREIIDEDADGTQSWWQNLTAAQQNVLRAVAATNQGMTTKDVRRRFALDASGSVSNTLRALVEDGRLARTSHGSGYTFDNPYVRGWVIAHALPDLGIREEPTFIASPTDEYDQSY